MITPKQFLYLRSAQKSPTKAEIISRFLASKHRDKLQLLTRQQAWELVNLLKMQVF